MKRRIKESIDEHIVPIKAGAAISALVAVASVSVWAVNSYRDLKDDCRDLRRTLKWHTKALENLHQNPPKPLPNPENGP